MLAIFAGKRLGVMPSKWLAPTSIRGVLSTALFSPFPALSPTGPGLVPRPAFVLHSRPHLPRHVLCGPFGRSLTLPGAVADMEVAIAFQVADT